ncbi:MAG TPA: 6,7-dimethyl-8-ribityllumazine synthase [Phycisphaerales bacterium]|nr:6,7-dimethyl-8-ribityllumazine synthase [Phycisphaerales bacterium]
MSKRSLKPSSPPPVPTSSGAGAPAPRIAVVVSRYNWTVTGKLLEGARKAFASATGSPLLDTDIYFAPGAFEVVALSNAAAESRVFDGVVALGCIIKGETSHDEVLGHAVTQALANIPLVTGVPVTLGVLTVNTPKQAAARAGGRHGNKGAEAMGALLATLAEMKRIDALRAGSPPRSFEIDLSSLAGSPDKLMGGR